MSTAADFIRAYPDKKYWTLYDSKDKKVADFSGDNGEGVQEFEKFYGLISDGKYRLCVHKTERLDRGCNSLTFTKNSTQMAVMQAPTGTGHSDFLLSLVADNARYKVIVEMQEKRIERLEARMEQIVKAVDELTDDDDSNDETALSRLKNDFGDVASLAANARKFF